jgi:hypothetical protein
MSLDKRECLWKLEARWVSRSKPRFPNREEVLAIGISSMSVCYDDFC